MNEVEEISRVFDGNSVIVVLRNIRSEKSSSQYMTTCENGMTLSDFIVENFTEELLLSLPTKEQIEAKIERLANVSRVIDGMLDHIRPTSLSTLFLNIINSLDNYEHLVEGMYEGLLVCAQPFSETYEYMERLNELKQKLLHFYRNNPYRSLELSDDLSQEILTPEICLTELFLPYIKRELDVPKWMVPRTVRTLNDACRIYQTREFIKKEGMELFMVLACYKRIPLILWKMISHYAVDMTKLRFRWFDVITEKMLRGSMCVKVSHLDLDLTTRIPNVIHIV